MTRLFVERHIAGDTLEMSIAKGNAITVEDYPASDGWTLKYRLTPQFAAPVQTPIDITASTDSDGESYKIEVSNTATAAWAPGKYTWSRWVEKAGARATLDTDGQLDILQDPATAAQGYDSRSHPRKVLEAIEAVMESRASSTQRELVAYTIGSRSQTFDSSESKADLVTLRSKYLWLVANEDARDKMANGLPNPRDVGIRFGRP
jgi:hypothetical protein